MTTNTRAIAVQGIGFAVAFVAVQGFAPIAQPPVHVPAPERIINVRTSVRVAEVDDAARAIFVKHEGRIMTIEDEDRSTSVALESRTLVVEDDDRVIREQVEDRTTVA